jgi:hypothetical protein
MRPRLAVDDFKENLFDPWALLAFPPELRSHLVILGERFFGMAFEQWGIEGNPSQVAAIAEALDAMAQRLREIGEEPEVTDLERDERMMCERAGSLAERVAELARSLSGALPPSGERDDIL